MSAIKVAGLLLIVAGILGWRTASSATPRKLSRPAQRSIVSATRWATEREWVPDRFGAGLDAWTVRFTSI